MVQNSLNLAKVQCHFYERRLIRYNLLIIYLIRGHQVLSINNDWPQKKIVEKIRPYPLRILAYLD